MERRNKDQFPGALPGEADGCECISKEMGSRKVKSSSPEDTINHYFSSSTLCLDFPLFEGKLFLRLSKEEWDDNRLFLHCFAHYLVLVSGTAGFVHAFSDYFSCLLDVISTCVISDTYSVFGTIYLKPELPSDHREQLQQSSAAAGCSNIHPSSQQDFEGTEVLPVSHLVDKKVSWVTSAGWLLEAHLDTL